MGNGGTGVVAFDLAAGIGIRHGQTAVFYQDGAESQTEAYIVCVHKGLGFLHIPEGQPGHHEQVALVVHKAGVQPAVGAVDLAVVGDKAVGAEFVKVTVGAGDGIDAAGHVTAVVLLVGAVGIVGKEPADLAGMFDLDLTEGIASAPTKLLPGDGENGFIQIVDDL